MAGHAVERKQEIQLHIVSACMWLEFFFHHLRGTELPLQVPAATTLHRSFPTTELRNGMTSRHSLQLHILLHILLRMPTTIL